MVGGEEGGGRDAESPPLLRPLAEWDYAEWVNVGRDLDTWPGARVAAHRAIRRNGADVSRKPDSPAVLAAER